MNDINKHTKEGDEWAKEINLSLRSRLNKLSIGFGLAMILSIVCVATVWALIPLKTVEAFVVEVDKVTGETKVLKQYTGTIENTTLEEVLSKYWINQYMIARESYSPKLDIEENYAKVEALSEPNAFQVYAKRFTDEAPDNPFTKYKDNRVRVAVKTISFLRKDTATVRYELIEERQNGEAVKTSKLMDILQYKYTKTPTIEKDAFANPLGFKIIEYRTAQEVIN